MSGKIEPGCLALIIQSVHQENVGKVVTVESMCQDGDWKIVSESNDLKVGFVGRMQNWGEIPASSLMRIDDYDPSTEETTSDEEVTV